MKIFSVLVAMLIASNAMSETGNSNKIAFTGNDAPQINSPVSVILTGDSTPVTVVPTGPPPFSYQWQKDNGSGFADILGATGSILSFSSSTPEVWNVRCLVNNGIGPMSPSNTITLTVYQKLTITKQPIWQAKVVGDTVIYTVLYNGGVGPIGCQWLKDGTPIADDAKYSGTLTTILTISNAQLADQGGYSCRITDSYASVGGPANQVATSTAGQLSIVAHLPVLTLAYNSSDPTKIYCTQDSGDTPLEVLCPGNGSWANANGGMGIRFVETAQFPVGATSPSPMTADGACTFTLTSASFAGFNGKIAPFLVIGGSNKYLVRSIEQVMVSINGGALTPLGRSDGNYFDLVLPGT